MQQLIVQSSLRRRIREQLLGPVCRVRERHKQLRDEGIEGRRFELLAEFGPVGDDETREREQRAPNNDPVAVCRSQSRTIFVSRK